jgi:hypothetical protein
MVGMMPFVGRRRSQTQSQEAREDSENELLQRAQQWREAEERQRKEHVEGLELQLSKLNGELQLARNQFDTLHHAYEHLEKERSNERFRLHGEIQKQGKELHRARTTLERQNQTLNQLKRQVVELNHELELSHQERKELESKVRNLEKIITRLERSYVGETSDVPVTEKQIIKLYDELYDLVTLETVDIFCKKYGDNFLEAWDRIFRLFYLTIASVYSHCISSGLKVCIQGIGSVRMTEEDSESMNFVLSQHEKFLTMLLSRKDSKKFMEVQQESCLQKLLQDLPRQQVIPANDEEIENLVVKIQDFCWKLIWNESTSKENISFEFAGGGFLAKISENLKLSKEDIERKTEKLEGDEGTAVRQALQMRGQEIQNYSFVAFPMLLKRAKSIKSKTEPIAYRFLRV